MSILALILLVLVITFWGPIAKQRMDIYHDRKELP